MPMLSKHKLSSKAEINVASFFGAQKPYSTWPLPKRTGHAYRYRFLPLSISKRSETGLTGNVTGHSEVLFEAEEKTALNDNKEIWQIEGQIWQRLHPSGGDPVPFTEEDGNEVPLGLKSTGNKFLDAFRGLFIPQGFPNSVSPDYLPYQLTTLLTHVTGWCEASLATSTLLKAVGVGASVEGVTAATAGIKWILKDGVGAVGRLFIGGGLAGYFDEEPRRWRMTGELVNTVGVMLEIATAMYPKLFLVLAGGGTLAKSVGKGMGKPAFRVMQQHFAISRNVGDVAAKEEVWEVAGQMSGIAVTVVLLKVLESHQSAESLLLTWAVLAVSHIYLRYRSLKELRFTSLNQKRACILVSRHVAGVPLPGVEEANLLEPILPSKRSSRPSVAMACKLSDAAAGGSAPPLERLLELYGSEAYLLLWGGGEGRVVLKEGFAEVDKLKALWQARRRPRPPSRAENAPSSTIAPLDRPSGRSRKGSKAGGAVFQTAWAISAGVGVGRPDADRGRGRHWVQGR
uniref:Upf0420 protein n=1 Tax=Tetraselmis sp. GSL018 TaxID=582737 RepID=A0A061S062_9CHLO